MHGPANEPRFSLSPRAWLPAARQMKLMSHYCLEEAGMHGHFQPSELVAMSLEIWKVLMHGHLLPCRYGLTTQGEQLASVATSSPERDTSRILEYMAASCRDVSLFLKASACSPVSPQMKSHYRGEQLAYVAAFATGAKLVFGDRPKEITYRCGAAASSFLHSFQF